MNEEMDVTAARIRQEHAELLELERQLLKTLAERCELPTRVSHLVESIYQRASAHLEDEVQGFLNRAASIHPELRRECDLLCREHAQLRQELNEVLNATQTAEGSPEWWEQLDGKCREFVVRLNRHEYKEQKLLDHIEAVEKP